MKRSCTSLTYEDKIITLLSYMKTFFSLQTVINVFKIVFINSCYFFRQISTFPKDSVAIWDLIRDLLINKS